MNTGIENCHHKFLIHTATLLFKYIHESHQYQNKPQPTHFTPTGITLGPTAKSRTRKHYQIQH